MQSTLEQRLTYKIYMYLQAFPIENGHGMNKEKPATDDEKNKNKIANNKMNGNI